jgi:protein SCO1/2
MSMTKGKSAVAVYRLTFLLGLILSLNGAMQAQQVEHYSSPLYSPRVYEPGKTVESKGLPTPLKNVSIEQKLNEPLPLDAIFSDENGNKVRLGDYFGRGRPVVIALVYYECPMLCTEVLNGLTGSLKGISLDAGKDFDVIALSFDAREDGKAELAKSKKDAYVARYGRKGSENGWHFLTGAQSEIDKVTQALGFNYYWDDETDQFAHAGAVMVITPQGLISRYLYGIDYPPRDLKFSIMESAENKIGSLAEQLYLYCFHYNPATGTYGFAVLTVIRVFGVVVLLGIITMWIVFWRRNKKKMTPAV